jgi:hypothetical protein
LASAETRSETLALATALSREPDRDFTCCFRLALDAEYLQERRRLAGSLGRVGPEQQLFWGGASPGASPGTSSASHERPKLRTQFLLRAREPRSEPGIQLCFARATPALRTQLPSLRARLASPRRSYLSRCRSASVSCESSELMSHSLDATSAARLLSTFLTSSSSAPRKSLCPRTAASSLRAGCDSAAAVDAGTMDRGSAGDGSVGSGLMPSLMRAASSDVPASGEPREPS